MGKRRKRRTLKDKLERMFPGYDIQHTSHTGHVIVTRDRVLKTAKFLGFTFITDSEPCDYVVPFTRIVKMNIESRFRHKKYEDHFQIAIDDKEKVVYYRYLLTEFVD